MEPFVYELPTDRIAQRPVHPADTARMMVIERASRRLRHLTFRELPSILRADDHLVFNDTRVVPARLFGTLSEGIEHHAELLLVREEGPARWLCLGRPLRKIRAKGVIAFSDRLWAQVVDVPSHDRVVVEFRTDTAEPLEDLIRQHGTMPIPPYIRQGRADEQDLLDYQTIFAEKEGSIAAPTASLHFTPELMSAIADGVGCKTSRITLHVGSASFLPVLVDGVLKPPGSEQFIVAPSLLDSLQETRRHGGRVVAVGTTVVRALESAVRCGGSDNMKDTELFIQPGFEFQIVSSVVTNFHQPGTTHLLLVEALLGRQLLAQAYEEALSSGYRFLSYGDGMLIV